MTRKRKLKTFSRAHLRFLDTLFERIRIHYDDRLVSLAVYGSYARGENKLNSDLDLMIILKTPIQKGRFQRIEEFVESVEMPLEAQREAHEQDGVTVETSPLILDTRQAGFFLPLYLDMVESHLLLVDKDGFLEKRLRFVREQMKRWGSQKRRMGDHWYWHICPGLKWGETIDYDK